MLVRNFILLWKTTLFFSVLQNKLFVIANSEEFLNSVITRLKEEQGPRNNELLYQHIFEKIGRSVDGGYQIHEPQQELLIDPLYNPYQLDNENILSLQQANQNQDLSNFGINNELSLPASSFQPYDIKGNSLNLPQSIYGFQEVTAPQTAVLYSNETQNAFNQLVSDPLNFNWALLNVNNDQYQATANENVLPHVGNDLANEALTPTYYNYVPSDNTVYDNLADTVLNAMKTHQNEYLGVEPNQKFFVEPLFVAMAGFVGIAVIFMSAVLFLPKLLTSPPKVSSLKGPQELAALTKLAVEAIDGKDCTERIACEVGRAMRSMQVSSKPIRILEVILPSNIASQLAQIRKAIANKQSCKLIQCKRLTGIDQPRPKIADKKGQKPEPKNDPLNKIPVKDNIKRSAA